MVGRGVKVRDKDKGPFYKTSTINSVSNIHSITISISFYSIQEEAPAATEEAAKEAEAPKEVSLDPLDCI